MGTFDVGWAMGLITGIPAGVMATLTYQWWKDRKLYRRRVELDDYTARLRALSHRDDEYLMAQLRKANREGLL